MSDRAVYASIPWQEQVTFDDDDDEDDDDDDDDDISNFIESGHWYTTVLR